MDWWYDFLSRHPQIMASKPDWLMRGKVNDQYIKDVQSGQLKCTKFRRALLSAIQYIQTLNDASSLDVGSNSGTCSFNDMFNSSNGITSLKNKVCAIKPIKSVKVRKSKENKLKTSQHKSLKNSGNGNDELSRVSSDPGNIYEYNIFIF